MRVTAPDGTWFPSDTCVSADSVCSFRLFPLPHPHPALVHLVPRGARAGRTHFRGARGHSDGKKADRLPHDVAAGCPRQALDTTRYFGCLRPAGPGQRPPASWRTRPCHGAIPAAATAADRAARPGAAAAAVCTASARPAPAARCTRRPSTGASATTAGPGPSPTDGSCRRARGRSWRERRRLVGRHGLLSTRGPGGPPALPGRGGPDEARAVPL